MSGAIPWFSTSHLLFGVQNPRLGVVTTPPSIKISNGPWKPTSPPHVRFPTNLPILACRKCQGIASPPDPAYSLMIIALGPRIRLTGVVMRSEEHTSELQSLTNLVC